MTSQDIFTQALSYEKKIRDLYQSAVSTIDDDRGKAIFQALADDEQSHVDFLEYALGLLASQGEIDISKLTTGIPEPVEADIRAMTAKIPDQMLGDTKRVLNTALAMEVETSRFYENACKQTSGKIAEIFEKFYEIEQRHVDVVQIELDHAVGNGHWFNFMEIDMED